MICLSYAWNASISALPGSCLTKIGRDKTVNSKFFDILVIGSGMGGMSSAALLAKAGFRVLVTERMPRIGGRCSTMDHKGFKCITGVVGVETQGVVEALFRRVGAEFDVKSAGIPHYLIKKKVVQALPNGGMKRLLEATGANPVCIEKIMSALSKALQWQEPSSGVMLYDWLCQYTKDPGILSVFQTLVSATLMVNLPELPASHFFKFIKTLKGVNSFGYCPKGSFSLPDALGKVIQRHGGEIWTSAQVTKLLTEKGVVQGALVQTQGREFHIDASAVVCNAGPRKTVELVGLDHFDPDYLCELSEKLRPSIVICLQFALDQPLFEYNHLLITGTKRVNAVYQPTIVCPDLAPDGQHLLVVGASPSSSEGPVNGEKEIELCMKDLRKNFPQFDDHARILLSGIYQGDWPGMHSWPGRDMPVKTPIINLYNVGDGVKENGYTGLPSVVKSGMMVAEEITQRIGILKNAEVK